MKPATQDRTIAGWHDVCRCARIATLTVALGLTLGAAEPVPLLAQAPPASSPGAEAVAPPQASPQAPPEAPTRTRRVPATQPAPSGDAETEVPATETEATEAPALVEERRGFRCDEWSHRPVFKLGQDHRVRAADSVRDTVVVFGSVVVEGEVCGDLVVVLGNVELASSAYVQDTLSVVGGKLTAAEGAVVDGDLVVVGGAMEVPATFVPGREQILVGLPIVGDRLLGIVPWLTRGLLYGRLIVPDLAWNWYVVAITLFVVLLLNLLFPRATTLSTAVIHARPLSAFVAGLLVLLLSGPVVTLLAVSIIGAAIVPVVILAMFAGWLVGSIAVARWIGASLIAQDDPDSRSESTRSLFLGFIVKVVAYIIPLLGITVWALTGVMGLGAATLALIGAFRSENPKRTPPAVPPPPLPEPDTTLAPLASAPLGAAAAAPIGRPPGEVRAEWPLRDEHADRVPPAQGDLRRFPRGSFLERLAALVLDLILIGILGGAVLDLHDREGAFIILALTYHVIFWAWKGTTIGGVICQLRLVRVDGRPLEVTDAIVRALTGVLSMGALGLGFLWILRDEQRQSWHDMVAGTLVVKVPRGMPLP